MVLSYSLETPEPRPLGVSLGRVLVSPVSFPLRRSPGPSLSRCTPFRGLDRFSSLLVMEDRSGDLEAVKGVDGFLSPEGWGEGLLPGSYRSPKVSLGVTDVGFRPNYSRGGHPWVESRV